MGREPVLFLPTSLAVPAAKRKRDTVSINKNLKVLAANQDRATDTLTAANDALFKEIEEAKARHQNVETSVSARLPKIGEVIGCGEPMTRNYRRLSVTKVTEGWVHGTMIDHYLTEYTKGRLARPQGRYRLLLTPEDREALEPLRRTREEALGAYEQASSEYFDLYNQLKSDQEALLAAKRDEARNGFDSYEYYDAYPEISIEIDGRSGGYLVEISDWSLEGEDETRTLTVPRDVLVQLVAKVIDASLDQGEEA